MPNPAIIRPEILFTHCIQRGLNLVRNSPTAPLKMSHHRAEPIKTPETSAVAETQSPPLAKPSPANIPTKDTTVIGLVRVRKNVET